MRARAKRPGTRGRGAVAAAGFLLALWAGGLGANPKVDAPGGAPLDSAAPSRPHSVRDSPGWYPNVDPESMSVAFGRRTNAPLVSRRFQGGARSLDDLGRRVCRALHHENSDSLLQLCVTADEFRVILWREFPQSRPATGLTWQDAWSALSMRLVGGCRGAVEDYGGSYYEFLRFEPRDTTAQYKNFKLHNGLILVARNDQGTIERFDWLRSVAERKGVFKIYSVKD
jgi:hypothetical protein